LSFETRRFPVSDAGKEADTAGQRADGAGDDLRRQVLTAPEVKAIDRAPEAPPQEQDAHNQTQQEQQPQVQSPAPETVGTATDTDKESAQSVSEEAPAIAGDSQTNPEPGAVPADLVATASANPEPTNAEASSGRYVVQVASLSSAENASKLAATLRQRGFPVLMDTIESDVGQLKRVRVGPYPNESDAVQASARIGKEFSGVSPRVLDLQPDQTAQVTSPADPLVRWVVQLGSFSDATNAERLVQKIRNAGLNAYQEKVTSGAVSIFRVRVGPFLEREEALRTSQQLSEQYSVDGVVMSAD
jgi:DedD protein